MISATNRDLTAAIADEKFRSDLYYRLRVAEIDSPPLRERAQDVLFWPSIFFRHTRRNTSSSVRNQSGVMRHLANYRWPGNVRELRNAIERSAVLARAGRFNLRSSTGARRPTDSVEARSPEQAPERPLAGDNRGALSA